MSTTADVKRLFYVYIEAISARLKAYNNLNDAESARVETAAQLHSRAFDVAEAGLVFNEAGRALVEAEMELYAAIVNLPD